MANDFSIGDDLLAALGQIEKKRKFLSHADAVDWLFAKLDEHGQKFYETQEYQINAADIEALKAEAKASGSRPKLSINRYGIKYSMSRGNNPDGTRTLFDTYDQAAARCNEIGCDAEPGDTAIKHFDLALDQLGLSGKVSTESLTEAAGKAGLGDDEVTAIQSYLKSNNLLAMTASEYVDSIYAVIGQKRNMVGIKGQEASQTALDMLDEDKTTAAGVSQLEVMSIIATENITNKWLMSNICDYLTLVDADLSQYRPLQRAHSQYLRELNLTEVKEAIIKQHGPDDWSGVQLATDDETRFCIFLPDATEQGKVRISEFDANGFYGHATRDTYQECFDEAVASGMKKLVSGQLEKLFETRAFARGNHATTVKDRIGQNGFTFDDYVAEMARWDAANPENPEVGSEQKEVAADKSGTVAGGRVEKSDFIESAVAEYKQSITNAIARIESQFLEYTGKGVPIDDRNLKGSGKRDFDLHSRYSRILQSGEAANWAHIRHQAASAWDRQHNAEQSLLDEIYTRLGGRENAQSYAKSKNSTYEILSIAYVAGMSRGAQLLADDMGIPEVKLENLPQMSDVEYLARMRELMDYHHEAGDSENSEGIIQFLDSDPELNELDHKALIENLRQNIEEGQPDKIVGDLAGALALPGSDGNPFTNLTRSAWDQLENAAAEVAPALKSHVADIRNAADTPDLVDGSYDYLIKIAADDIERLRKPDVIRVIDQDLSESQLSGLAAYIIDRRPDLADEVAECLEEIKIHDAVANVEADSNEYPASDFGIDINESAEQTKQGNELDRDVIAARYAEMLANVTGSDKKTPDPFHYKLADSIIGKDAYGLEHLANGLNDTAKAAFTEFTGIKLDKAQGKTWDQIREWAGLSPEKDAMIKAERKANWERDNARGKFSKAQIEECDQVIEKGFDRIEKQDRAYWLLNDKGEGYNLSKRGSGLSDLRPYIEAKIAYLNALKAYEATQPAELQSVAPEADQVQGQDGDYDYLIKIAADDIERLRKPDVIRVLDQDIGETKRAGLAAYIVDRRPDLADEVAECLEEIKIHDAVANVDAYTNEFPPSDFDIAGADGVETEQATADESPAAKEAWETTRDEWVRQQILQNKYASEYLANPEAYSEKANQLESAWIAELEKRAAEGRISDVALDDLVRRNGTNALSAFRGAMEKGIEGYLTADARMEGKPSYERDPHKALKMLLEEGNDNLKAFSHDNKSSVATGHYYISTGENSQRYTLRYAHNRNNHQWITNLTESAEYALRAALTIANGAPVYFDPDLVLAGIERDYSGHSNNPTPDAGVSDIQPAGEGTKATKGKSDKKTQEPVNEFNPDLTFTFGKYAGETIGSVFGADPDYVNWVVQNTGKLKGAHLTTANALIEKARAEMTPEELLKETFDPEQEFTFGKHSGKTIQQVADTDMGYLRWAAGNLNGNKLFIDTIKELVKRHDQKELAFSEGMSDDEVQEYLQAEGISYKTDGGNGYPFALRLTGLPGAIGKAKVINAIRDRFPESSVYFDKTDKSIVVPGISPSESTDAVRRVISALEGLKEARQKAIDAAMNKPSEELAPGKGADLVGDDVKALIRKGLDFGIKAHVVENQIEDIGRMLAAYTAEKPAFVLGNEAGTGKTFVLGGFIHELKRQHGVDSVTVLTMNTDLIAQFKKDLSAYDIGHVNFATYAALSNGDSTVEKGSIVLADEAHNLSNIFSNRGAEGQAIFRYAPFTVISSATPFNNPVDAQYIAATGLFEANGFSNFGDAATTFGAIEQKFGYTTTYKWGGDLEAAKAFRQWFFDRGMMTQRPMELPTHQIESDFVPVKISQKFRELYDKVDEAYAVALAGLDEENADYGNIKQHRENTLKRILEAGKLESAADEARVAIANGRYPVIYTESRSARHLGRWRKLGADQSSELYDFAQMAEMMAEWEIDKNMARQHGGNVPPPPFARFVYDIAAAFDEVGIDTVLPPAVAHFKDALGSDMVAEYTGGVSGSKAGDELQKWRDGEKPLLVATMAKGGTGLSLHDQVGDHQTTQIIAVLPWTARILEQVLGRTARYGLVGVAEIKMLIAPELLAEKRLCNKVATRLRDMGATVKGVDHAAASQLDDAMNASMDSEVERDQVDFSPEALYRLGEISLDDYAIQKGTTAAALNAALNDAMPGIEARARGFIKYFSTIDAIKEAAAGMKSYQSDGQLNIKGQAALAYIDKAAAEFRSPFEGEHSLPAGIANRFGKRIEDQLIGAKKSYETSVQRFAKEAVISAANGAAIREFEAEKKEEKDASIDLRGYEFGHKFTSPSGENYRLDSVTEDGFIRLIRNEYMLSEQSVKVRQDQYDRIVDEHKEAIQSIRGASKEQAEASTNSESETINKTASESNSAENDQQTDNQPVESGSDTRIPAWLADKVPENEGDYYLSLLQITNNQGHENLRKSSLVRLHRVLNGGKLLEVSGLQLGSLPDSNTPTFRINGDDYTIDLIELHDHSNGYLDDIEPVTVEIQADTDDRGLIKVHTYEVLESDQVIAKAEVHTETSGRPMSDDLLNMGGMIATANESCITAIEVDPQWRGLGIGKMLMDRIILDAQRDNADILTLSNQGNEAATSMYKQYGFINGTPYTNSKGMDKVVATDSIRAAQLNDELKAHRHKELDTLKVVSIRNQVEAELKNQSVDGVGIDQWFKVTIQDGAGYEKTMLASVGRLPNNGGNRVIDMAVIMPGKIAGDRALMLNTFRIHQNNTLTDNFSPAKHDAILEYVLNDMEFPFDLKASLRVVNGNLEVRPEGFASGIYLGSASGIVGGDVDLVTGALNRKGELEKADQFSRMVSEVLAENGLMAVRIEELDAAEVATNDPADESALPGVGTDNQQAESKADQIKDLRFFANDDVRLDKKFLRIKADIGRNRIAGADVRVIEAVEKGDTIDLFSAQDEPQPGKMVIEFMSVEDGFTGSGIGTHMIRMVENEAVKAGMETVDIKATGHVGDISKIAESLGYTLIGDTYSITTWQIKDRSANVANDLPLISRIDWSGIPETKPLASQKMDAMAYELGRLLKNLTADERLFVDSLGAGAILAGNGPDPKLPALDVARAIQNLRGMDATISPTLALYARSYLESATAAGSELENKMLEQVAGQKTPANASNAPEHINNMGKPLDESNVYPRPEEPGEQVRELPEGIMELNIPEEDFGRYLSEFEYLMEDSAERVKAEPANAEYISKEEAQERIASWKENVQVQYSDPETRSRNSRKWVLSLFDSTGNWSRPWEEAGYNVLTFDIQNGQDIMDFSAEHLMEVITDHYIDPTQVYFIMAATPCTDFASSGARWFAEKDADGRTEASKELVFQALRTIEFFRPIGGWALENPVGRIERLTNLPKARYAFQPHHFGEDYTKQTILWGRFETDLPTANTEPTEGSKMHSQYGGSSLSTKNARSATPEGFAYAFFAANNYEDLTPIKRLRMDYKEVAGAAEAAYNAGLTEESIRMMVDLHYGNEDYNDALMLLGKAVHLLNEKTVQVDDLNAVIADYASKSDDRWAAKELAQFLDEAINNSTSAAKATNNVETIVPAESDSQAGSEPGEEADLLGDSSDGKKEKRIEDTGYIPGAAKERWARFKLQFEALGTDFAQKTVAQIFPIPNYEQLVADGDMSHRGVALLAAVRAFMLENRKPRYGASRWVQAMESAYEIARDIVLKPGFAEELYQKLNSEDSKRDLIKMAAMTRILEQLPVSQIQAASTDLSIRVYAERRETGIVATWTYTSKALDWRKRDYSQYLAGETPAADRIESLSEAYEKAAESRKKNGKSAAKIDLSIRHYTNNPSVFYVFYKPNGGKLVKLEQMPSELKSSSDRREWLAENRERIESQIDEAKNYQFRRSDNTPRVGTDWRGGRDIDQHELKDEFGLRDIQFGNSTLASQKEAQARINDAYDSLCDLSHVLNISRKAVGLHGSLALAFGARGRGGSRPAMAHYEPGQVVINMTRKNGAGSLAHEWFHAFDNYFRKIAFDGENATSKPFDGYATASVKRLKDSNLREEVRAAFEKIYESISDNEYHEASLKLDQFRGGKAYWSQTIEKAARAFEAYVREKLHDEGMTNDYLVNLSTPENAERLDTVVPTRAGLQKLGIQDAFDDCFSVLQEQETEKGILLFRNDDPMKEAARQWMEAAQNDDLFRYKDLTEPAHLLDILEREGYQATHDNTVRDAANAGWSEGDIVLPGTVTNVYCIDTPMGDTAYVYETDKEVWLDVSGLKSREGMGSEIYQIVAAHAYHSNRVFIGDPEGLSEKAVLRRTEAMLSSALRFGTAKHLAPHSIQQIARASGVNEPLEWGDDDAQNIANLVRSSYYNVLKHIPEIANVEYDFERSEYRVSGSVADPDHAAHRLAWHLNRDSQEVGGSKLGFETLLGRELPDLSRAMAGSATIKRAVITQSLISKGNGEKGRFNLADYVAELLPIAGKNDTLRGILYSNGATVTGLSKAEQVIEWIKPAEEATGVAVRVVETADDLPRKIRNNISATVKGVYDWSTGTPWIIADRIRNESDAVKTALHEGLGHKGAISFLNRNAERGGADMDALLETIYNDIGSREILKVVRGYSFDLSKSKDRREAVLEYIAHLAESGEKPRVVDQVVAGGRDLMGNVFGDLRWTRNDILNLIESSRLFVLAEQTIKAGAGLEMTLEEREARREQAFRTILSNNDRLRSLLNGNAGVIGQAAIDDFVRGFDNRSLVSGLGAGKYTNGHLAAPIPGSVAPADSIPMPVQSMIHLNKPMASQPARVIDSLNQAGLHDQKLAELYGRYLEMMERALEGGDPEVISKAEELHPGEYAKAAHEQSMLTGTQFFARVIEAIKSGDTGVMAMLPESMIADAKSEAHIATMIFNRAGIVGALHTEATANGTQPVIVFDETLTDKVAVNGMAMKLAGENEIGADIGKPGLMAVNTPAFESWFKGSEVVDKQGNPQLLFVGTNRSFDEFDHSKAVAGDGLLYATNNPVVASDFAMYRSVWPGANVMPVFVNAAKMLEVDADYAEIRKAESAAELPGRLDGETVAQYAARNGYDGIVYRNTRDDATAPTTTPVADVYAFLPTAQFKSAIGNNGQYSPESNNILEKRAYHGSPFMFSRASLNHVGTGSGQNSFGWGLYFASQKEQAELYAKSNSHQTGVVYEAEVPDTDELLNWSLPVEQQSQSVRDGVTTALNLAQANYIDTLIEQRATYQAEGRPVESIAAMIDAAKAESWADLSLTGAEVYQALKTRFGSDQKASEILNDAGVPGSVFITDAGDETYCIWDESVVTIDAINDQRLQAQLHAYREHQAAELEAKRESLINQYGIHADDLKLTLAQLAERDNVTMTVKNSSMEPGEPTNLPLGSISVQSYGSDLGERYVMVLREVPLEGLKIAEPEDNIRKHPTFAKYVEWAKEGREAPPIHVNVGWDGQTLISANRRRPMAAIEAGHKTIKAWVSPINPETGNPLKYNDLLPVMLNNTMIVNGVERPVLNSAGKRIHPTDEGVRNFWRWNGDSKVVDAEGRPLVVYHGTESAGFAVFDPSVAGENTGRSIDGIYFTNHVWGAQTYSGTRNEANITDDYDPYNSEPGNYHVYLSMQNPAVIDFENQGWDAEVDGFYGIDEFVRYAIDAGFDGVIAKNISDEGRYGQGYGHGDTTYIVFNSEQIKSATGNNGEFNPAMPSILARIESAADNSVPAMPNAEQPDMFGEARKARAELQGFGTDTVFYRTRDDLDMAFTASPSGRTITLSDDVEPVYLKYRAPYMTMTKEQALAMAGSEQMVDALAKQGYDAIAWHMEGDATMPASRWGNDEPLVVVFDASQVASVSDAFIPEAQSITGLMFRKDDTKPAATAGYADREWYYEASNDLERAIPIPVSGPFGKAVYLAGEEGAKWDIEKPLSGRADVVNTLVAGLGMAESEALELTADNAQTVKAYTKQGEALSISDVGISYEGKPVALNTLLMIQTLRIGGAENPVELARKLGSEPVGPGYAANIMTILEKAGATHALREIAVSVGADFIDLYHGALPGSTFGQVFRVAVNGADSVVSAEASAPFPVAAKLLAKRDDEVLADPFFTVRFGESVMRDVYGTPIVAHKLPGQHEEGPLTFTTALGAKAFSGTTEAFLRIENPLVNAPNDPFIDVATVVDAIGADALRLAKRFEFDIYKTDQWKEVAERYDVNSVTELFRTEPEAVNSLYFPAYRLMADSSEVEKMKAAGFDGAIYADRSSNAPAFVVFGQEQVIQAANHPAARSFTRNPEVDYQRTLVSALQKDGYTVHTTPTSIVLAFAEGEIELSTRVGENPKLAKAYGTEWANMKSLEVLSVTGNLDDMQNQLSNLADNLTQTGMVDVLSYGNNQSMSASSRSIVDALEYSADDNGNRFMPLSEMAQQKKFAPVRFLFAGRNANTADLTALDRAEEMESRRNGTTHIWQETGWYRGVDNQWRFEVLDQDAEIRPTARNLITETVEKMRAGETVVQKLRLGDLLKHDQLYQAYPGMVDIPVSIETWNQHTHSGAMKTHKDGSHELCIVVDGNDESMGDIKRIALHEIQHLIQLAEGFAMGGNTSERSLKWLWSQANIKLERAVNKAEYRAYMDAERDYHRYFLMQRYDRYANLASNNNITRQARDIYASDDLAQYRREVYDECGYPPNRRNISLHRDWLQRVCISLCQKVAEEYREATNDWRNIREDIRELKNEQGPNVIKNGLRRYLNKMDKYRSFAIAVSDANRQRNIFNRLLGHTSDADKLYFETTQRTDRRGIYKANAGEAEARNTESRSLMPADELRDKSPGMTFDIPESSQIVGFEEQDIDLLEWLKAREGEYGIKINVVPGVADLPTAAREVIRHSGKIPQAAIIGDDVYIVQQELKVSVAEAILHEAAHKGVRTLFGESMSATYQSFYEAIGQDAGLKAESIIAGFSMADYFTAADRMLKAGKIDHGDRVQMLVDEFIAHAVQRQAVESLSEKARRLSLEFAGEVRNNLRNAGLLKTAEMNDADIAYILKTVHDAARGRPVDTPVIITKSTPENDLAARIAMTNSLQAVSGLTRSKAIESSMGMMAGELPVATAADIAHRDGHGYTIESLCSALMETYGKTPDMADAVGACTVSVEALESENLPHEQLVDRLMQIESIIANMAAKRGIEVAPDNMPGSNMAPPKHKEADHSASESPTI